jgi:threonylcarbamoyladenosine tRNA methylthiotransferase MtaB
MNVALYTLGCKLNYAETSQLQRLFEQAGHTIVPFGSEEQPADAVIINTCTVTENADRECRQIVRRALRSSPHAFIGVTGCYAQLQPEEIASIEGVDAVFGAKEKFHILPLVQQAAHRNDGEPFRKFATPRRFVSELDDNLYFVEAQSSDNDSRTRAFLKLQDGCNYKCSFCTIPMARGKSRSMDFTLIPDKIRALEAAGYHEVVLSGINLGDYKAPSGERFVDVVRCIDELHPKPKLRVRISSIEPNLLTQEILEIVSVSRVFCHSFHIPLQSGSPEILRQMRRRYKVEHYRNLVERVKTLMPDAAIGVDVIVGFPGETNKHFEETFAFLHTLPISYLHVFSYSERENTPAAAYSAVGNAIPMHVRAERSKQLRMLSAQKRAAFYHSQLGTVRTMIPETYNAHTGRWKGWTENYVRVECTLPSGALVQQPVRVRLLNAESEAVIAKPLCEDLAFSEVQTSLPSYIPILV